MSDLKPRGVKAPLNLLPALPLQAIAGAMEHGAVKYAPWNWQDIEQPQAELDELVAAILRHATAVADPSRSDYDEESGIHHLAHVGAGVLIYLWKAGIGYQPSKLLKEEPSAPVPGNFADGPARGL